MSTKPPLNIDPVCAEYYSIHFMEWDGDTARLHSGSEENDRRKTEIELVVGTKIELVPAPPEVIAGFHRSQFGIGAAAISSRNGKDEATVADLEPGRSSQETERDAGPDTASRAEARAMRHNADPSVIQFVERVIIDACRDRATDIHLEPFSNGTQVRYRIDGVLHRIPVPRETDGLFRSIVSRIKILSRLDIAEQRLPQDGRFNFLLPDGDELDIRVSVLPTPHGESVDLRLLAGNRSFSKLPALGLSKADEEKIVRVLERPHGVILVTGPTGSGKTTSLYAFLSLLNQSDRKILTMEDPIEYEIPGVTQVQVHPKIGLTFAHGLRSMLRHDPDVMMVGEIRDFETADTAVQVALTGHLVFSTVHTNDAPSTPARLVNMGVEPYLVASSLECVIAQRLVRLVCGDCAEETTTNGDRLLEQAAKEIEREGIDWNGRFRVGRGCRACMDTGYLGRTAVYEIVPMFDELQTLVLERQTAQKLREASAARGHRNMRSDGLEKVARGITTFEEISRVTRGGSY